MLTLKSCGPRSPITSRWTAFFSSANGSVAPAGAAACCGRVGERRSWRSIYALRPNSRRPPRARSSPAGSPSISIGELPECLGRLGLRLRDQDRLALVDRTRDVPVARHEDVGLAAHDRDDVVVGDADAAVGPVEDELDVVAREAHQLERLEAELRVLERQRVEHPDHADAVALSIVAITSGVKPGGVSTTT